MKKKQTEHRRSDRRIHEGRVVTKAQEDRLIRKAKGGEDVPPDERARGEVVKLMRPFVAWQARKQTGYGVAFEDLVQVGEQAVLEALDAYTPRGAWFISYAGVWIHGRMRRAIANQARAIRVPEYRVQRAGEERLARERAAQKLGRTPTDFDVAREMNVPVEDVWRVALEMDFIESIERAAEAAASAAEEGGALVPRSIFARPQKFPESEVENIIIHKSLPEGVRGALRVLEGHDGRVLRMRYLGESTRREISERTGLSEAAIRHSERRALKELRRDKNLRDLWKFVWN